MSPKNIKIKYVTIHVKGVECRRCGHQWVPFTGNTPDRCARCKRPDWAKVEVKQYAFTKPRKTVHPWER
jgi:predicted Zn-ribbon and HTH transcriptional regulator